MKITLVAVALSSLAPGVALACSPPLCLPGSVFPATGSTVPLGVPALAVRRTFGQAVSEDAHLVLGNATVPASLVVDPDRETLLLVPEAPLSAGTYTIVRSEGCGATGDAGVPTTSSSFTVGAAAPLPVAIGTVAVVPAYAMVTADTGSGSCTIDFDAAVAKLALTPSADLAPWLATTSYTLEVDGAFWATSEYGAPVSTAAPAVYGRHFDEVFARCGAPGSGSGDDNGLARGPHHAVLRAHVAGATTDPAPVAIDFALTCPTHSDGGIPFEDGGATDAAAGGAKPSSSGCSIGARDASLPWLLLPCIALYLALRRRAVSR